MEHGNHATGPEPDLRREVLDLRRRIQALDREQRTTAQTFLFVLVMLVIPGGQQLMFLSLVIGGLVWIAIRTGQALDQWVRGPNLFRSRPPARGPRARRRAARSRRSRFPDG